MAKESGSHLVKTISIDIDGEFKEIVVVGETHIYGSKESNWANELLLKGNFDIGFIENAKMDRISRFLFILTQKIIGVLFRKDKKNLITLAKENELPLIDLEGEQIQPLWIRAGLSLIMLGVLYLIFQIILISVKLMMVNPVLVIIVLAFFLFIIIGSLYVAKFLTDTRIGQMFMRILPVNLDKRDEIMSFNLVNAIKENEFKKGFVVVGKLHFPQIVKAIQNNFKIMPSETIESLIKEIRESEDRWKAPYMATWRTVYEFESLESTPQWNESLRFDLPASKNECHYFTPEKLVHILRSFDDDLTFRHLNKLFGILESLAENVAKNLGREIDTYKFNNLKSFLLDQGVLSSGNDDLELKLAKETRNCDLHNNRRVDPRWLKAFYNARKTKSNSHDGDPLKIEFHDVEKWNELILDICEKLYSLVRR